MQSIYAGADYAALHAQLDECPSDWKTRLVLADWYEDHEMPVEAAAQRWQVAHRKRPWLPYKGGSWSWCCASTPAPGEVLPYAVCSELTIPVWQLLEGRSDGGQSKYYDSRQDAERALLKVLQLLGEV